MNQVILKKHIAKIPLNPGVYMFSFKRGKILYIGKASNLKNRLNSYLRTDDSRIKKMIASAHVLKSIETESDIEALILESQLIKKFRPQFNIVMRDDKQYAFVGFTHSTNSGQAEKFPRIFITHQPKNSIKYKVLSIKNQNIRNTKYVIHNTGFIGPFTDVGALKTTLRYLRRIFPYCTCRQLHHNYCLNYHIGKCMGVCCLKDSPERSRRIAEEKHEYQKNIRTIKDILSGKRKSLIKKLEREMIQTAKNGNLEKAIELRDKISKIKRVFENAKIIHNKNLNSMIYHTVKENRVLKSLQKVLKLSALPHRIEGYDVSNIGGVHATGSMVTFTDGQPNKNFYRKFKIHTKQTIREFQHHNGRGNIEINNGGDTGMLREILERRFRHSEWPFPDLILIDGGKGQVNMAVKTLQKMSIKIQIIGISKNEHHLGHQLIIPGRKTPLSLTKLSSSDKNLLLAIDSEAHRFAIGYYRKLHRKLFR